MITVLVIGLTTLVLLFVVGQRRPEKPAADFPSVTTVPEPTVPSKNQSGPRRERWTASPEFTRQLLKDSVRVIQDGPDDPPTDAMWKAMGVAWAIVGSPTVAGAEPSEKLQVMMGGLLRKMGVTATADGVLLQDNPIFRKSHRETLILLYKVGRS